MAVVISTLESVEIKITGWFLEGRNLPLYPQGHEVEYLAYLLGIRTTPAGSPMSYWATRIELRKKFSHILRALDGPHGWAILQTLIAKKGI